MELKRLSLDAVPAALLKAERYRLLNEPVEAESICLDILAVDPDSQPALTMLILAITDQFGQEGIGRHMARAQVLVPRLQDEYSRAYYGAIVIERRARAHLAAGDVPHGRELLAEALDRFDRAVALRPAGNDDAILRWNACVRTLERLPAATPAVHEGEAAIMSE